MRRTFNHLLLASYASLVCIQFAIGEPVPSAPKPANAAKNSDVGQLPERSDASPEAADAQDDDPDEDAADGHKYIRITRDDNKKPSTLETSIVTFAPAGDRHEGVTIELVGAVHVGDAEYYAQLNKVFESYDVLLFELVAPEGTRIPKGGRKDGGSAVGALQNGMSSLLELEHQLEQVDYTKDNFVHADMTPEEFAKSMTERGESFFQLFLKALGQNTAMQATGKQPISDADILFALLSKDRSLRLKRLLARQFEDMESAMSIFDGPEGSTLITERNKKCFEVLKKELEKGHKRIGVFYGAGHLADMEKRLNDDFEMRRTGEKWITAWDLKSPAKPAVEDEPAEVKEADQDEVAPEDDGCPFDDSNELKKAS